MGESLNSSKGSGVEVRHHEIKFDVYYGFIVVGTEI